MIFAQGKAIKMIAGLSKPPFVIAEKDKGMQIEIIEAAFAEGDQSVRFTYLPTIRHLEIFHSKGFDGIVTLAEHEKEWGICLSKPYIVYQNIAVTLAKSAFTLSELKDLAPLKVAAFQNATRFIGGEYSDIFKRSKSYIEIADQIRQIDLLYSGQVDVLIMDINIFKHVLANKRKEKASGDNLHEKYVSHFLFDPTVYTAGFKTNALCQQFDDGMNAIIEDGNYQKIIDSYLSYN
jgi:polar amino acid transport system substrate-binding protein